MIEWLVANYWAVMGAVGIMILMSVALIIIMVAVTNALSRP